VCRGMWSALTGACVGDADVCGGDLDVLSGVQYKYEE
jgi:hypothetical protein